MTDTEHAQKAVDRFAEADNVTHARYFEAREDIELRIKGPNYGWGLPSELHDRIRASAWHIDDFSHIRIFDDGSGFTMRLYLRRDD